MEWMDEMLASLQQNRNYLSALDRLKELDEAYSALRETLDEQARELLDAYISACEEIDDILCTAAYNFGRRHR